MSEPRKELLAVWGIDDTGCGDVEFDNPEGLASDSQGNMYVADEANHRVQKITPDGKLIYKIGGISSNGRPRMGTAPGEFNMHRSVHVDAQDNLYVGDSRNCRVQKFDAQGKFLMLFGSQGNALGQFGGFSGPNGVAVDEDGYIYVTDTHTILGGNSRVQKFDAKGHFIKAWGEYGTGLGQFAGRIPLRGRYGHDHQGAVRPEGPYGIGIGKHSGLLTIADTDSCRLQIFDREGKFIRTLGEGIIYRPRGLCLDSQENIYVAGFHDVPDLVGLTVPPVRPEHRMLWVLNKEGKLLLQFTHAEARGLFVHGGGRHHAVAVSKVDESLLFFQAGHHILKWRIYW
ncbi:MAG: NHL repeat-containing protein [Chloroflexi bacterium]|nr:NHL repeat-containing protein [Chloroflexota bacterium]